MSLKASANAFHPVLQYNYRNCVMHSKYLKHFSIFKMTCFNKETITSISNATSMLCLIVFVGGGDAPYFALKTFFIHVTVNTDQNEQMLWPNRV